MITKNIGKLCLLLFLFSCVESDCAVAKDISAPISTEKHAIIKAEDIIPVGKWLMEFNDRIKDGSLTSENFVKAVAMSFNIFEKFNDAIQDKYGDLEVFDEHYLYCRSDIAISVDDWKNGELTHFKGWNRSIISKTAIKMVICGSLKCASLQEAAQIWEEKFIKAVKTLMEKGVQFLRNPRADVLDQCNFHALMTLYESCAHGYSSYPDMRGEFMQDFILEIIQSKNPKGELLREILHYMFMYEIEGKSLTLNGETWLQGIPGMQKAILCGFSHYARSSFVSSLYTKLKKVGREYTKLEELLISCYFNEQAKYNSAQKELYDEIEKKEKESPKVEEQYQYHPPLLPLNLPTYQCEYQWKPGGGLQPVWLWK